MNRCNACRSPARLRCSKCRNVFYCNAECQKQDWQLHKMTCISSGEPMLTVQNKEESLRDRVKQYLYDRKKSEHEHWVQWGQEDPYYGYVSEGRYARRSLEDVIWNLQHKASTFEDLEEAHKIHWDRVRCDDGFDPKDKKLARIAKQVCNQVRICLLSQGYTWEQIQQVQEMPEYEYPTDSKIKDGSIRTLFTSKHTRNYMQNHFPDVLDMYGQFFISKQMKEELRAAVKKHNGRVGTQQNVAHIRQKMNVLENKGIPLDCAHLIMEFLHNKNIMEEVTKTI